MEAGIVALIVLGALVVFSAFWSGVVWLIARMGWSRLAEFYETDLEPTGRRFYVGQARVGISGYSNVLRVHVEPEGLRLSVMPLFRPGHPPLLIPWDEITDIRAKRQLVGRAYALDIGDLPTVTLPASVVEAIQQMGVTRS